MSKRIKEQEEKHVHSFGTNKRCICGCESISEYDYIMRQAEWAQYYELIRLREPFLSFQKCHKALLKKDTRTIRKLVQKVRQRLTENTDYIPKPSFSDPDLEIHYRKLWIVWG